MPKFDNELVKAMIEETTDPQATLVYTDLEVELIHDALLIAHRLEKDLIIKKAYLETVKSDRDELQRSGSWDMAAVMFREACKVTDEIEQWEGILSGE